MTTIKTPEQIAAEIVHKNGGDGPHAYRNLVAAIEADREQRDLIAVVAEALDDRGDYEDNMGQHIKSSEAAQAIRSGDQDHIWEQFIAPMLDEMEEKYGR